MPKIVTVSYTHLDIRGFEAKTYHTKDELQKLIEREIEIYTAIKEQNFDSQKNINKQHATSHSNVEQRRNPC